MEQLPRGPLRGDIYSEIIARIYDRRLAPGAVLRDTEIAASLGVSRTPVREALIELHRDGFVDALVGRGYRVGELTLTEARNLYPIVWTLEELALRSAPEHTTAQLEKLKRLNKAVRVAKTAVDLVAADDAWHCALLEHCTNTDLLNLIRRVKARLRRYELAYMRDTKHANAAVSQHAEILAALEGKRIDQAARVLVENWRCGVSELQMGSAN